MGNCIGCAGSEGPKTEYIVKIQRWYRQIQAVKELKALRKAWVVNLVCKLKRPTAAGLDTGPVMFTQAEIDRIFEQKSPRRYLKALKEDAKGGTGDEAGKKYQGQWRILNKKLVMDGIGVLSWPDGSVYIGQFENDKMCGRGRMTQSNGDVYQGDWKNNMANGNGCIVNSLGGTSDGEWVDDLQHGFGKETWEFGKIKFSGQYVKGQKQGRGRYEWVDRSFYEGDFDNSQFSGYGTYYFAESEKTYEGYFAENVFEGKGKITFKDGRQYTGDFKAGLKNGQGTMIFQNGNKYIGAWKDDLQHGIGIYFNAEEEWKKQGEWKDGKRIKWLCKPIKLNGENNLFLQQK